MAPTSKPCVVKVCPETCAVADTAPLFSSALLWESSFPVAIPAEVVDEFQRFLASNSVVGDFRQKMIRGTPASLDICFEDVPMPIDPSLSPELALLEQSFWGPANFDAHKDSFLKQFPAAAQGALGKVFAVRLQCALSRYQYVGSRAFFGATVVV